MAPRCSKCGKAVTKAIPARPKPRGFLGRTRKAWVTILNGNADCPRGGSHKPGKGS